MDLEKLATIDVEGAVLRDLHDRCRERIKADVPDAPDWMIEFLVNELIGRPRPGKEEKRG